MRPRRPALALCAVALVAACGTSGTDGVGASGTAGGTASGASSSTSSTTTPTTPEDPTAPPATGGKVRLVTVTGTVSAGVESGCLLLTPVPTDTNGPWMLVGNVAQIRAGQQVTVRGYRVEDVASTCQQGRPFRVETVLAG